MATFDSSGALGPPTRISVGIAVAVAASARAARPAASADEISLGPMSEQPSLTLHVLPPSHPCMTVEAALRRKDLDYEKVALSPGRHVSVLAEIYGEEHTTVPGMLVDGEPVHGSTAILPKLEELRAEPALYPEPIADAVREAELWGDAELQDLGRRMPWGALHFRPEAMGTFGGGEPLDPAGTDFAMKYVHGSWKYHKISAERLASDLAGLPEKVAHIESLAADGVIGGDAAERRRPPDRGDDQGDADRRRPRRPVDRKCRRADRPPLVPRIPRPRPRGRVPGRLDPGRLDRQAARRWRRLVVRVARSSASSASLTACGVVEAMNSPRISASASGFSR